MLVALGDAAGQADAVEVLHHNVGETPLLRLCTSHGCQILEHVITGEMHPLRDGGAGEWQLFCHNGRGLLRCPGKPAVWANSVLNKSLWRCARGLYVQTITRRSEQGTVIQTRSDWLRDLQRLHQSRFLSWTQEHGVEATLGRTQIYELQQPRPGSFLRYFWSVLDMVANCQFKSPSLRSSTVVKNAKRSGRSFGRGSTWTHSIAYGPRPWRQHTTWKVWWCTSWRCLRRRW